MKDINTIYKDMIQDVYTKGLETSPRNMKVKELLGYSVVLDPNDNVITLPGVATNLDYAKEELLWYLNGTNRIDFSDRIKRVWSRYSDDGETVNSNYGNRLFGKNEKMNINQWEWAKNKLREDSDSRQALMNINSYFDKEKPTKDFPCTIGIQAFIRENKLHWVVLMRSNDIFKGFRNDMYCFTELQKRMAEELKVEVGDYHHFASSMHLYEQDFDKAKKVLGLESKL